MALTNSEKANDGRGNPIRSLRLNHPGDISVARRAATAVALALGFSPQRADEVTLVVSELSSNLIKHAGGGIITFTGWSESGQAALEVEARDEGPGIARIDLVLNDGYSTAGGLGVGLGCAQRLADSFEITSPIDSRQSGTRVVCKWRRLEGPGASIGVPLLDIGVATRPRMGEIANGDEFVTGRSGSGTQVGVIDGLGHGPEAQRAAQAARAYIDQHPDDALDSLFRGVEGACRVTRGVVLALGKFNATANNLRFASVGNIEARAFWTPDHVPFVVRRGVMGMKAPNPVVTEHSWSESSLLVIHSDGLSAHWDGETIADMISESAARIAERLLSSLAKDEDDATVLVVKSKNRDD